jgi:glycosyltransferase involved in cell wall biosynthesis
MYSYIEKNLESLRNIKLYIREDSLAYLELISILYFKLKQLYNSIKDLKNPSKIISSFFSLFSCSQYRKVKKYQILAWKKVDFISAVNFYEKRLIEKEVNKNVVLYPHGIDLFEDILVQKEEQNSLVFLGNYSYAPNIDGILWFIKNVFPKLLNLNSEVKLYLIGPNITEEIYSFKKIYPKNLIILGWVENPIEHLNRKSIFINPIFVGGGQRVKLLYALKSKIPIISTSLGISGFPYPPIIGKEILLANTQEDFILQINRLLKGEDLRKQLAENGYEFLEKKYQWKKIFEKIEKDLVRLIKS